MGKKAAITGERIKQKDCNAPELGVREYSCSGGGGGSASRTSSSASSSLAHTTSVAPASPATTSPGRLTCVKARKTHSDRLHAQHNSWLHSIGLLHITTPRLHAAPSGARVSLPAALLLPGMLLWLAA